MGCFSFLCKECGKGIKSNSFSGEHCHLILLKNGIPIQAMEGEYNSYGGVFIDGTQRKDVKHSLRESREWRDPSPDPIESPWRLWPKQTRDAWGKVCDLMFSKDVRNGIAAVHVKCFKEVPTTRSENDPNQGWGDDDELLDDHDPNYDYGDM